MRKPFLRGKAFLWYDEIGDNMIQNEFDDEIKYRLFRSVKDILHPAISKKNVSNYKIVIEQDILPVRIFYPKRVTGISKIMIMIHGNAKVTDSVENYSNICKKLSTITNAMIIAIEYKEKKESYEETIQEVYKTVKYLYDRLMKNNIEKKDIILVGDSTGCNIITAINYLNKKDISIEKEILFYPTLSLDYWDATSFESLKANETFNFELLGNLREYFTFVFGEAKENPLWNPLKADVNVPKTLVFAGKVDSLRDEAKAYQEKYPKKVKFVEVPFASHGFLKNMEKDVEEEIAKEIENFINA